MRSFLTALTILLLSNSAFAEALLSTEAKASIQGYLQEVLSGHSLTDDGSNYSMIASPRPVRRIPLTWANFGPDRKFLHIIQMIQKDFSISFGKALLDRTVFLMVVPTDDKHAYSVESYSHRNETLLFIPEDELNADTFALRLVHEMALVSDRTTYESVFSSQLSCAIKAPLQNRIIKIALSTLRAYAIEQKIRESRNLPTPLSLLSLTHMSCEQKILTMSQFIHQNIYGHPILLPIKDRVRYSCSHPGPDQDYLAEDLKNLFTTLRSVGANSCDKLLEPRPTFEGRSTTGNFVFDFQEGPRPRIGTGSNGTSGLEITVPGGKLKNLDIAIKPIIRANPNSSLLGPKISVDLSTALNPPKPTEGE